jgi:hypothetical protein
LCAHGPVQDEIPVRDEQIPKIGHISDRTGPSVGLDVWTVGVGASSRAFG